MAGPVLTADRAITEFDPPPARVWRRVMPGMRTRGLRLRVAVPEGFRSDLRGWGLEPYWLHVPTGRSWATTDMPPDDLIEHRPDCMVYLVVEVCEEAAWYEWLRDGSRTPRDREATWLALASAAWVD